MLFFIVQVAQSARSSEYIHEKNRVSARMSISACENLISASEQRMLINKETSISNRITDLWGIIPAINGNVELVYEGEQEGTYLLVASLIGEAIKKGHIY